MARTYEFIVGKAEAGARLDRYLVHHLPESVSRAMIQRGIRGGTVKVGGYSVKAHHKLRSGEQVNAFFVELPAPARDLPLIPQDIPLSVIHEDEALLVVDKPPGLVTHPAPGHWDGTLVNAILWHLQRAQGSRLKAQGNSPEPRAPSPELVPFQLDAPSEPLVPTRTRRRHPGQPSSVEIVGTALGLPRAGIIHRLDKDTSGLLLVAKSEAVRRSLSNQLKARHIHRSYVALVDGHLPLDSGRIRAPIGRHLTHRKVMAIRHLGGRAALTHYRVLLRGYLQKNFGLRTSDFGLSHPRSPIPDPQSLAYTALALTLETGRTHQIRVHLAHLGHPVLGDTTYGSPPQGFWTEFGIFRQLLHAYKIRFTHPLTQRTLELRSDIPEDMARWLPPELVRQLSRAKET